MVLSRTFFSKRVVYQPLTDTGDMEQQQPRVKWGINICLDCGLCLLSYLSISFPLFTWLLSFSLSSRSNLYHYFYLPIFSFPSAILHSLLPPFPPFSLLIFCLLHSSFLPLFLLPCSLSSPPSYLPYLPFTLFPLHLSSLLCPSPLLSFPIPSLSSHRDVRSIALNVGSGTKAGLVSLCLITDASSHIAAVHSRQKITPPLLKS